MASDKDILFSQYDSSSGYYIETVITPSGTGVFGFGPDGSIVERLDIITTGLTGNFASASGTGNFITVDQTGAFAPAAGTGAFITTGQTGAFAPAAGTGEFATTGYVETNYINRSESGQFAPAAGTGSFITTSQTGAFAPAAGTGDFVTTSQLNSIDGTTSQIFQIQKTSGVIVKSNNSGDLLEIRNSGDTEYRDIRVRNLYVDGTQTIIHSQEVTIDDNILLINNSGLPQDAGIQVYRSGETDSVIKWSESNARWEAGLSGTTQAIVLANQTGSFVTTGQTGAFAPAAGTGEFATTGYVDTNYYPRTNPSGYLFWSAIPTGTGDVGVSGAIAMDSGYLYACIGTNNWRRTILAAW